MINSIRIQNFKCFEDETIPLKSLTVLSGVNGMGKSSFLQSFLLLRQSLFNSDPNYENALLNGPLVSLGYSDDVLYEGTKEDGNIAFTLTDEKGKTSSFSFVYEKGLKELKSTNNIKNEALMKSLQGIKDQKRANLLSMEDYMKSLQGTKEQERPNQLSIEEMMKLLQGSKDQETTNLLSKKELMKSLLSNDFYYLKAERIGPRTSFQSINHDGYHMNAIGNAGEYCAYLLAINERKKIKSLSLLHESNSQNELRAQVEAWLSDIGQAPRIHLDEAKEMDLVKMQFSFMRNGIPSNHYRPTNVGFGLTYALPIFVACLLANPGATVIIENPEAHLHPKGQMAMGKFLSKVAASGIQILIETHSDHVLNGIRIAAKKKFIPHSDVALHFFQRKQNGNSTTVVTPKLDQNGR